MTWYPESLWALASHGLPGEARTISDTPLSDRVWRAFVAGVVDQQLMGLLADAVERGAMAVTESQRDDVGQYEERVASTSLRLDELLVRTVTSFEEAGIDVRVLKGAALAYSAYPDARLRPYRDVDLLVRPDAFDDALQLLMAADGLARFREPRRGFIRRFGKGLAVRLPGGLEVDLHRTFVSGPFGLTVDLDELFELSTPFVVGGRTFHGLGTEERFVHACYHAVLGSAPARILPIRDVAQLATSPGLDSHRARKLAGRWSAGVIVAHAVDTAWNALALTDQGELASWAAEYRPSRSEVRNLDVYRSPRHRYAKQSIAALRAIPGLRDRVAYAGAMLVPDRRYLAERDGRYARRFARAVRLARGARE